ADIRDPGPGEAPEDGVDVRGVVRVDGECVDVPEWQRAHRELSPRAGVVGRDAAAEALARGGARERVAARRATPAGVGDAAVHRDGGRRVPKTGVVDDLPVAGR